MKKKLKCILFDFDGVLSNGRFYSTIENIDLKLHTAINRKIFSKESVAIVERWMNGNLSFEKLHAQLAPDLGVSVKFLNKALIDSVLLMQLNNDIMQFAEHMRGKGIITAIFTDNMDVFDRFLVPYNDLTSKFDYIFSSSKYKKLKNDNNGEFLKEAMSITNIPSSEILFIDDSDDIGVHMRRFGGNFYLYNDYENGFDNFNKWFDKNFDY